MSQATDELAMSRIGIALIDGICARARQIWRETPHTDVGLDGTIEFKDGERATGVFLGVQVKTGVSYLSEDGETFTLKGDQEHFAYWASCSIPVIGVVVDPVREIAMWVDMTALCSIDRIAGGPYTASIARSPESAFTVEAVAERLKQLASSYSNQRFTQFQFEALRRHLAKEETAGAIKTDGIQGTEPPQRLAWNMLCADFCSPRLTPEEAASIGQRLAWYFPTVPDSLKEQVQHMLAGLDDGQLARAIVAARAALDVDRDDVAELVAELIAKIPRARERMLSLLERGVFPRDDRDAAIQIIEGWDDGPRDDLRKSYLP